MSLENLAITKTNNLPIFHEGEVHDGKVRSVYWLNKKDSSRIGEYYGIETSQVGAMIIGDGISAYECKWKSEDGLNGVPGKGASLNMISKNWFDKFEEKGLAGNHIIGSPHPLVWFVQRADPIMVEAIARQYITGGMWRDYVKGSREFCGIELPEGLQKNQKLNELLITPTTKGILRGIPGVPEQDDVNITRQQIVDNYKSFGFKSPEDIVQYERLLTEGFGLISSELRRIGKIFVDTKFEFGYDSKGSVIYIDEIGTPDSSRKWEEKLYTERGIAKEESKEAFREDLQAVVPDKDVLLNKERMDERKELARTFEVPTEIFMRCGKLYTGLAKQITGNEVPKIENAREEILDSLSEYRLVA